jgi:HK97 family phage prohead protease
MNTKTMTCKAITKAVGQDQETGERFVEQIVSVFNNVDLGGDRVLEGAFTDSLAEWEASGNPIPVYFSHQWQNPAALIGEVVEAKELSPGDPLLSGTGIEDLGGLWVKYSVDQGRPYADDVFHNMERRRITQASFAYDAVKEQRNSDGTNDLIKLKVHEVGPTLLGMNPATTLLSAKDRAELAEASGVDVKDVEAVIDALAKQNNHTFLPSEEDPSRCGFPDCGKTQGAVAHIDRLNSEPDKAKAFVSLTGSLEERQATIFAMAEGWARDNNVGNGGFWGIQLEATFPDRAVFRVEGFDDPWGGGDYYEAAITDNADGTLGLAEPLQIQIVATTVPKSIVKAFSGGILTSNDNEKAKSPGKVEEPQTAKTDDQTTSKSESEGMKHAAAARARMQLLDLSEE